MWQHLRPNKYMKGSTLIETLIYIALLSVLMLGMFSSVFMFTDSKNTPSIRVITLGRDNGDDEIDRAMGISNAHWRPLW